MIEIKKLTPADLDDFISLIEIFKDVFEQKNPVPNKKHLVKLLKDEKFFVFVIKLNDIVIGGSSVHSLPSYYGQKPLAYIYDVGVSESFQGKGFGKKLITHICEFFQQNNFELAYVEAETDDIDAIAFYRKTNFSEELQATHFTYQFNYPKI